MFDVFGSIRSLLKVDQTCIDNNVFRLHYKVSVIILVASSLIVTSRQYIGDPISCTQPKDVPAPIINQYCWIHSTFTIPSALTKKVGVEVAHPGIETFVKGTPEQDRTYHSYYQWVCFVLFFQAALFYIPRYIWKIAEGGKLRMLILGMDSPVMSEDAKTDNKKLLLEYMVNYFHTHTIYVAFFIFCELLNFVNVVGQIYLMDSFLGGEFTTYGSDVVSFTETDQQDRADPMIKVFPRVTKCTFHTYGMSGDVQKHDSLCVLPLNIVNEKIYVFLWFWFVILACITGVSLLYRTLVIVWPKFRMHVLRSRSRLVPRDYLEIVVRKSQLGDWFVLDLLAKNMDSFIYREFLTDLARKIEGKELL